MVERNPPVWMQSGTYSAAEDRMVTGLLSSRSFDSETGITRSRVDGGVVGGLDQLRVTASGVNTEIQVSAGAIIIPAGVNPPGAYLSYNDGPLSITLDVETSSNPRKDLIVAEVIDSALNPDAVSLWRIRAVKGSPSPSPVAPNPGSSTYQYPIATVTVKPAALNGGSNKVSQTDVTDVRMFNSPQGGVYVKWSGLPYPTPSPGRLVYDVNGKKLQVSNGVAGGWSDVYSQEDWKTILSAMGPRQITRGGAVERKVQNTWTASPVVANSKNNASAPVVSISNVRAPNGKLKITVGCIGKVAELTSSGHITAQVLKGSSEVFAPGFTLAPSFYSKTWAYASLTFLASGLPKDDNLTVRLVYARRGGNNGTATFSNVTLMVEPTY